MRRSPEKPRREREFYRGPSFVRAEYRPISKMYSSIYNLALRLGVGVKGTGLSDGIAIYPQARRAQARSLEMQFVDRWAFLAGPTGDSVLWGGFGSTNRPLRRRPQLLIRLATLPNPRLNRSRSQEISLCA